MNRQKLRSVQPPFGQFEKLESSKAIRVHRTKVQKPSIRSVSLPVQSKSNVFIDIEGHQSRLAQLFQELTAIEDIDEVQEQENKELEEEELDDEDDGFF